MKRLMWVVILPVTVPLFFVALALRMLTTACEYLGRFGDDLADVVDEMVAATRRWAAQIAFNTPPREPRP